MELIYLKSHQVNYFKIFLSLKLMIIGFTLGCYLCFSVFKIDFLYISVTLSLLFHKVLEAKFLSFQNPIYKSRLYKEEN